MIGPKLQKIIDGCKHRHSRAFFEHLFSKHEQIMESLDDRAKGNVAEQTDFISFDDVLLDYQWDESEQLDELGPDVLDRYKDRANSQLRRGIYASKFTKPAVQAKKRANRLTGVKQATSRLNTFNNDEHANTQTEGVFKAVGSTLGHLATHSVASGLGVSHGTVSSFLHHLSAKQKHVAPKVSAQKPPKTRSQQNGPQKQKWEPVEIHHVYSGTPSDHEHSLRQALNHHNIATFNKSKGDNSKAEIHFRARDKHFRNYVTNAPRENLKKLNQDKVKSIFN